MKNTIQKSLNLIVLSLLGLSFILIGGFLSLATVRAQTETASPLHPTYRLLDSTGQSVLETGNPVSTMQTCGTCHDTAFIAEHSLHANVGAGFDSAQLVWERTSNDSEMNCFMCHLSDANYQARQSTLESDNSLWSATATLSSSLVSGSGSDWAWNQDAFNADGSIKPEFISIAEPSDANCGQCHGVVQGNLNTAFVFEALADKQWQTFTTGQVYSPQRISASGMNIADKNELSRSWDVHAERLVNCVDCHHALNNPVFYEITGDSRPEHLQFDPRRLDFGEYLERPLHVFANSSAADDYAMTGRTCSSCHDAVSTHTWLPYAERHSQVLACETCHIPEMQAPAISSADWTVLTADGQAVLDYRGIEADLLTGYQPTLLSNAEGLIAPYNLVSLWYWQAGESAIPYDVLQAVYFEGENYAPVVLAAFDADNDSALSAEELRLNSPEKVALLQSRFAELGYADAQIIGEVQAYEIHHGVTHGEWAIRDCDSCHSDESRINAPMLLANYLPNDVLPTFNSNETVQVNGTVSQANGTLYYVPDSAQEIYILGQDSVSWIDWFGILLFLGTSFGVVLHGGLRYLIARSQPAPQEAALREVYMYGIYERQWHWLQTVVIFGLIFTGLVIHKPNMFGMFSFRYIVLVHNALALIMVVNAALAAFYHLASGEIRQFLPKPRGFFNDMFLQAKYYVWGIFHKDAHPFEKSPEHKLNPIQQLTYFGLLNVLLPLQVITGVLMWGAQQFPDYTAQIGGLPFLAPFHSLVAWSLCSFIVLHVYMTTTGHTPLSNIKAMVGGWDEIEVHSSELQTAKGAES